MTHATRAALFTCFVIGLIVLSQIVNYVIITRYIGHTDVQWCDTLRLLTSHPIPKPTAPAQNPSRVEAYQLYQDFVSLKDRFGCQ